MQESQSENTTQTEPRVLARLALYGLVQLLVNFVFAACFAFREGIGAGKWEPVYLVAATFGHAALYSLPAVLVSLVRLMVSRRRLAHAVTAVAAFVSICVTLLLLGDILVLQQFGFHINGLVINLILTPGGFDSMGLDGATLLPAVLGILAVVACHSALAVGCLGHGPSWLRKCGKTLPRAWWCSYGFCLACLLASSIMTGLADFYSHRRIASRIGAFPVDTSFRMRTILKSMGLEAPPREKLLDVDENDDHGALRHYPMNTITRKNGRRRFNIVWLVGESLRGDFLTAEIMPATMAFSQTACRFENHYSGGHATRYGMFSMFYGLYGLNWDRFLTARRSPVLMDWLQDDGYQCLAQTSACFTYPEFDKTIFAHFSKKQLVEHSPKLDAWIRDEQMTSTMIDFIRKRDTTRPFFTFAFFESTHAPYSFPESAVIRKNYMKSINYATVSKDDAEMLYNRDVNAAHYLDRQLSRIYDCLAAEAGLLESTIVIVTGDHGEEFYENGRLGHTSSFVKAQLHVPLVLSIPGAAPRVITSLTSHHDIVPTLGTALGVENPAADYSVGKDLLSADYTCDWFVASGWQLAVLVNPAFKYLLPISMRCAARRDALTHFDDTPCTYKELKQFKQEYSGQLFQVQQALTRFVK